MNKKNIKNFIAKVKKLKKENKLDLSSDEDLSIAIMNLLSLEEHFFFTGAKTNKNKYYAFLEKIRKIRKSLLKKIIKNPEGEIWCISKHLLAASMRLIEVGTKELTKNNKKEAENLFSKAYDLYSLFWGINLQIINTNQIKKTNNSLLNKKNTNKNNLTKELNKLVKNLINCCEE